VTLSQLIWVSGAQQYASPGGGAWRCGCGWKCSTQQPVTPKAGEHAAESPRHKRQWLRVCFGILRTWRCEAAARASHRPSVNAPVRPSAVPPFHAYQFRGVSHPTFQIWTSFPECGVAFGHSVNMREGAIVPSIPPAVIRRCAAFCRLPRLARCVSVRSGLDRPLCACARRHLIDQIFPDWSGTWRGACFEGNGVRCLQ
jgi:hypothetical protein